MSHDDPEQPADREILSLPPSADYPEAPRLNTKLPPHPSAPAPGSVTPGMYSGLALATTAGTAFTMPVIVLSVGGWWLDQKLHHATAWFAMAGVILGLIAGVSSLLKVVNRLNER